MWGIGIVLSLLMGLAQIPTATAPTEALFDVRVFNTGREVPDLNTNYPGGEPDVGLMSRFHYYPAIKLYQAGRYFDARWQLNYVIERSHYWDGNPFQAQYMTTMHYVRGMIFAYHATGFGRLILAQRDFEAAIRWNKNNHQAYIELSRVFSNAGMKDQATQILKTLLELKPRKEMAVVAQKELRDLTLAATKTP